MQSLKVYTSLYAVTALALTAFVAGPAFAAGPKQKMSTPVISCPEAADDNTIELGVCTVVGGTGAPAGFSVQWITCDALAAGPDGTLGNADDSTWPASDSDALCKASFSGNANNTSWNLAAGACTAVVIGGLNDADPGVSFNCNDPLACETCYVFRAFAHANSANNRSDFTANLQCTTAACEPTGFSDGDHCTRSQGYFSSGNASREAMITCFGGDRTGAACTSTAGVPMVMIGTDPGNAYTWVTTGTCVDVQPGPGVFLMDSGIANLRTAIGGGGGSGQLSGDVTNPISMGAGGGIASQTAALTLNLTIAGYDQCADTGCTDGSAGSYADAKMCNFAEGDTFKNDGMTISAATAAALNGQTVAQILAAANAYLGGGALPYGLSSAADLNELVASLNLAFDLKDWDNDGIDDCACGGMTAFAESHLCKP